MSLINKIFFAIVLLLGLSIHSQSLTDIEIETLQSSIDANIESAQNNINNHHYFQALQDLEFALKEAKTLDDKKSLGLIYSKIGKVNYVLERPDEAMKMLIKASELQRFAKDDINIS